MRFTKIFALVLGAAAVPLFATSISFVGTPGALGVTDTVSWAGLGADGTALPATFGPVLSTGGGVSATGTFTGVGGLVSVVCGVSNCSWAPAPNFLAGDTLVWADDGSGAGTGPLSISFNVPVFGAGAYLQINALATFTGVITAFNGGTQLFQSVAQGASNANGDPVFLGVLDTVQEITRIVFSISGCTDLPPGSGCDSLDFAINTLDLRTTATPEPGSWLLLGSGLAALGFISRRGKIQRRILQMKSAVAIAPAVLFMAFMSAPVAQAQDGPLLIDAGLGQAIPDGVAQALVAHSGTEAVGQPAVIPNLSRFVYTIVSSKNGQTYSGEMAGGSPFNRGGRTTTIPVTIIPLQIQATIGVNTYILDPTAPDVGCLGVGNTASSLLTASPLFQNSPWTINGVNVGNTTYPDAKMRAQFWQYVQNTGNSFHLALAPTVVAKQVWDVTSIRGTSAGQAQLYQLNSGFCGTNNLPAANPHGIFSMVDINTMDAKLNSIITALAIPANQFAFFLVYGVYETGGAPVNANCCIGGYHSADFQTATGNPGHTYGIGNFDEVHFVSIWQDTAVISHEISEWINDPGVGNVTPPWGNIGQVSGCQANLEDGDPLTGNNMPNVVMGGFTYHLQELTYFSWFFGGPSLGAGVNKFSTNGTFTSAAAACP